MRRGSCARDKYILIPNKQDGLPGELILFVSVSYALPLEPSTFTIL